MTTDCKKEGLGRFACMVTQFCVGVVQHTKTYLTAVLGRSIRPKNISIPMNCAVKKKHNSSLPFGGSWNMKVPAEEG